MQSDIGLVVRLKTADWHNKVILVIKFSDDDVDKINIWGEINVNNRVV